MLYLGNVLLRLLCSDLYTRSIFQFSLNISPIKCHCQRKPGRGHGSRSADSFEIPTTDYLSDMIVKYSLFNLIGVFSCEFDHPPCFWLICIGLPSQFGVTCTSYFSYLLLVFSAFLIYLDYLRFDPIVFM